MSDFPPPYRHWDIEEPFPNVFFVTGQFRMGPGVMATRNMTVVREGERLVVLNSIRLSPEGEKKLDALGKVTDVVRVGAFHGYDDPYYVHRYGAKLWVPKGIDPRPVEKAEVIGEGSFPLSDAKVFTFEHVRKGEAAILLQREGGILVPCDAYQNWTNTDGCSLLCKIATRFMGFGPACLGAPWVKAQGRGVRADLEKLAELPFEHLCPAHGTVLRDEAREGLRRAITKFFGPA
jgi:hypothetical protein